MNFCERPSWAMVSLPCVTSILSPPAVNVPANKSFFAFCEMLMKPPAPASLFSEAADIDVSLGIDLREAEASKIEAAAVIEIELLILLNHGFRIEHCAEIQ